MLVEQGILMTKTIELRTCSRKRKEVKLNKTMNKNIISEFLKRPIAFHPISAKAFGSVKLAILWSQIYYWTDKTKNPDGWIYKTREDIYDEVGLSRTEQETARELGEKIGVLESQRIGKGGIMHYRIGFERSIDIIEKFIAGLEKQPVLFQVKQPQKSTASIKYLSDIPADDIKELCEKFMVNEKFIKARAEDIINYCESKGKDYRNYKAALRNFIIIRLEKHPEEKKRPSISVKAEEDPRTNRTPEEQKKINSKLDKIRAELQDKLILKK